MLDDFTSSGRGIGIMGFLIGAVVLAGFGGLALMTLNDETGGKKKLSAVVRDQGNQINSLKESIKLKKTKLERMKENQAMQKELEEARATFVETEKAVATAQTQVSEETVALEEAHEKWEDYKQSYRNNERKSAKGEMIDLSETMGERYKSVKVSSICAIDMGVMLDSGPKRIPFDKLPPAIQDRFQFDPEEASLYKKQRAAYEKARISAANRRMTVMEKKKDEEKFMAGLSLLGKLQRKERSLTSSIVRKQSELMNLQRQVSSQRTIHERDRSEGKVSSRSLAIGKLESREKILIREIANMEKEILRIQNQVAELQNRGTSAPRSGSVK